MVSDTFISPSAVNDLGVTIDKLLVTTVPVTSIPEPASLAVGLVSLGGLCLRRRYVE